MKKLATTKFAITKTTITRFSNQQQPGVFGEAMSTTSVLVPTGSI